MKKVVLVLLMLVTLMWLPLKASTPPSLHAVVNGKKSPLTLSKLKVDVKVSGLIAETKMTMTFYNPTNWVVEGQLTFPLPEGAFVSGYGLDINGQMVDGVVVEKERGRVVFETIVKRGTDPGLVEWSEGNSFKTRVYPIRRRNSRTIMVRYLSEIKKQKNKTLLHIPLNYNLKVDEFSLKVQLLAPSPTSENDTKDPADFQMGQWKSARVTESSRKNFLLDKDINIPVPLENIKEAYVEQNPDGQYYFSIHPVKPGMADPVKPGVADPVKPGVADPVKPGVAGPVKPVHSVHPGTAKGVKNKAPKHITILWDASGSMGKLDHKKEIILLKKYLSQYKTQSIRVSLKEFRFSETKTRHFKVNRGNAGKLLKAIKGIQYDGATSLNTITPSAKEKQPDFYLLFTDGNHNFGKWKKESLRFKRQVYVIIPAAGSNHKFLKSLAFETGGNALDLGKKENR
ncbi:MAG: VWA domain-containing protein, partial [bacterium]|nr:VWA domain-containing protein [bacterium]